VAVFELLHEVEVEVPGYTEDVMHSGLEDK
jgi:hypothetical protein